MSMPQAHFGATRDGQNARDSVGKFGRTYPLSQDAIGGAYAVDGSRVRLGIVSGLRLSTLLEAQSAVWQKHAKKTAM